VTRGLKNRSRIDRFSFLEILCIKFHYDGAEEDKALHIIASQEDKALMQPLPFKHHGEGGMQPPMFLFKTIGYLDRLTHYQLGNRVRKIKGTNPISASTEVERAGEITERK
jgi:hypothetical protein